MTPSLATFPDRCLETIFKRVPLVDLYFPLDSCVKTGTVHVFLYWLGIVDWCSWTLPNKINSTSTGWTAQLSARNLLNVKPDQIDRVVPQQDLIESMFQDMFLSVFYYGQRLEPLVVTISDELMETLVHMDDHNAQQAVITQSNWSINWIETLSTTTKGDLTQWLAELPSALDYTTSSTLANTLPQEWSLDPTAIMLVSARFDLVWLARQAGWTVAYHFYPEMKWMRSSARCQYITSVAEVRLID